MMVFAKYGHVVKSFSKKTTSTYTTNYFSFFSTTTVPKIDKNYRFDKNMGNKIYNFATKFLEKKRRI